MKLNIIFIFLTLIFCLHIIPSLCQDFHPHTRTIFDFYSDEHDSGKWKGYAYFLSPNLNSEKDPSLNMLILNESGLTIDDRIHLNSNSFLFICDFEENLPCSVTQFKKMFSQYFEKFIKNIDIMIKKANMEESGDQCMILHTRDINQNNKIIPYLICLYVSEQGVNLKFALQKAYIATIRNSDLENLTDTVQVGEKFDLVYSYDNFFSYQANALIKETEVIMNSPKNKTIIIPYNEIVSPWNAQCKIAYKNLIIPKILNVIDKDCCVSFNYTPGTWFLCSSKVSDCITPIRRFALFLMKRCQHLYSLSSKSSKNSIDYMEYLDDHLKGIWSGWGYFTYLAEISSDSKYPIFIRVDENNFLISIGKTDLPTKIIEILSLKWICGPKKMCSPEEYEKYSLNSETIDLVEKNADSFLEGNALNASLCGIFQDFSNKELLICIYNPQQFESFQSAMVNNFEKKLKGLSTLPPLPDNAIIPMLVTDGSVYFIEPIQFKINQAFLFKRPNSMPVVVYSKIDTINGESCQVLVREFNIPEQILNYPIDSQNNTIKGGHCCLTFKFFTRMIYMCSLGEQCEKIIERAAKKIHLRCEKYKNPNNLEEGPEIDYNGEIIDKHQSGYWAGYVKYAQLGIETPLKPMYVVVDPEKKTISIKSYSRNEETLQVYDILNLEWICQSELTCGPEEYISKKNNPKLKRMIQRIYLEMNIKSSLHCAALETRTTPFYFSQKIVGLFCPYDKTEGFSFRLAIKTAYDQLIEKTEVSSIPFAPEGSEFMITLYNENSRTNNLTSFRVRLSPSSIDKLPDESSILSYKDIKEIGGVKCGLEFRNLTLPLALISLNINPQCCFAVMKNKDKMYICSRSEIRCITHSRMMMKRIKEDCMTLLSINHEVSSSELKAISEEFELADKSMNIPNILGPPKTNDIYLKYDLASNLWEGIIYISPLDDKDQIDLQTKFLKLENNYIKITQGPETITNSYLTKKYHLYTIFFSCNSPDLCHPSTYLNQMEKIRSKYEIKLLQNAIENFMVKLPEHNKESNCLILEFEDAFFHAIKPYIICTKDQNQGYFLRKIISCRYSESLLKIDYRAEETKNLPLVSVKDQFPLKFYEEQSEDVTAYMTQLTNDAIKRTSTDFVFLRFKEIADCHVMAPVENKQILMKLDSDKIDVKCCFEVIRFEKSLVICSIDSFRCLRSKTMIISQAIFNCLNNSTNTKQHKYQKPNYHDDFSFEFLRPEEKIVNSDTDISEFKKDFLDDSDNGGWKGWVFANSLTERNSEMKIQVFYLEINRDFITYRNNVDGELIFLKQTKQLKVICEESDGPCTPSEYISTQKKLNFTILSSFQLKDAILNFLDQMPTIDESGCAILEFDEPKTRTRISEIVCSLFAEDGDSLRSAFINAQYLSLLRAEISKDISTVSYMTEVFPVKIWEEKRLMKDDVLFNESGLVKASNIDILLYSYHSIAQDQYGNRCAFWFKNLKMPSEFDNQDPNCCFTFTLKNGKNVYICANNPKRCISEGKMILLKMSLGCLAQNKGHMNNPYENENTVSPFQPIDNYYKILYDDSSNGIWRGLVFHHKLGSDETVSGNPSFMKIEEGFIYFYLDETTKTIEGVKIDPKEKLVIRNMYFTCEQPYTCDIKHYLEYFKENISDDGYDIFKMKADIRKVTEKLPTGISEDDCCTIVSFKDENSNKQNHIICTRVPEQGGKIKKALTNSLNNIILNSNITREIPLANLDDVFNIQFYDGKYNQIKELSVRFGKYYVFDSDSGESLLKYTDLKEDRFGTKCAIWNSQLTLPEQMTIESKECCFMLNKNDQNYYICSNGNFHCLKKARIMMKTFKEGCRAESNGLNLNGNMELDVPEIKNPNTEILGEKASPNDEKNIKTLNNFTHELNEDLIVTQQEDSFYKSWMVEFILPNAATDDLSPREIYMEITKKNIKIYQDVNSNILEVFNLTNINWICYKEYACLPSELMNHYRYLKDANFDMSLIEAKFSIMKELIPNEKQCVAIEFFKLTSEITDKRVFCTSVFNEKIIDILQKAIIKGFHEAVKTMPYYSVRMPMEYKDQYFVEYIAPGTNSVQSLKINFGEMGVEFEKETVFLYQMPDNCDICYEVVEKIENIHPINRCCLKMKRLGLNSYICDQDSYRCDINIKQIAKYLYSKCIDLNKKALDVHIPNYCLIEKKESLKYMPDLANPKNDFTISNILENCGKENVKSIRKANELQELIETHLLRVNKEITKLNKSVINTEKINDETINYNNDGSKTIIKPNGTQIIEDSNNSIRIIITKDKMIEILYFDGADYMINKNGENTFKLPDNFIIKIKTGNYEIDGPGIFFQLRNNGTAYLREENGKNTYIDKDSKSTTILKDGTKIMKKLDGLTEIDYQGSISVIKTPEF